MLDPQLLRTDPDSVAKALVARGYVLDAKAWRELETRRKALQVRVQELQNQKNLSARSIGQAKARGEDIQPLLDEVKHLGDELGQIETEFSEVQEQQQAWLMDMPNLALPEVPVGRDENDNVEIRRWGEPPAFDFTPRDHVELGAGNGLLDSESAAKLAGARFTVLRGSLSRLHRALAQFMLDVHTQEHGYTEVYLPYLVNPETMTGTGQLPKFGEDAFATTDDPPRYLVPTAEVPMTNLVAGEIIEAAALPLRYTSQTPCFRREAGSYGKDTRGMIRQHQFEKVELVQITKPESSSAALDELTGHAETILQRLGLHYRTVVLCTGDMGFSAAKTHDIEVWLPGQDEGQGAFREISSCSVCTDFQARRMKARWRNPETGKPELVHTLNGSGLAVGRTLIAVMENYQQQDGSIRIPAVLRPYMGGMEAITS
ncbi:MAG: serine--tRNA ligase [Xanthomonadales bacterium]|jgi:seryl-tRNA synthetase|nr:serine--tRNA ligase [Xanthomonadales bacterium]